MKRLEDLLDEEFRSPAADLYFKLAEEDQHLLAMLVEIRKRRGLSQQDVADALGLSQATISAFERLGNDPHLSTVRRYAKAVGVMVRHHVDERPEASAVSEYLTHVTDGGAHSAATAAAVARSLRTTSPWPKAAEESPAIKRVPVSS